ncbi:uncharacterized protein RSE6_06708 [Rhynchosporium secalis]|uniref:Uncharacterized protein n=1 Tax=Rhynchosporium secalis TaxID=38038 RepID=A0A1E1MB31_RHYSE|nr:uncharacterized protein RSE6_06708 [Rhynchosporium secalis]
MMKQSNASPPSVTPTIAPLSLELPDFASVFGVEPAAEDETYTGHWVVLELLPMEVNGDWELLGMEPLVAEGLELETGTWAGKVAEFTIETGADKVAVPTTGTEAGVVSQNVFAATLDA